MYLEHKILIFYKILILEDAEGSSVDQLGDVKEDLAKQKVELVFRGFGDILQIDGGRSLADDIKSDEVVVENVKNDPGDAWFIIAQGDRILACAVGVHHNSPY